MQRGFVVETITSTLKADAIDQLAKAQKVEMQVCRTEYTLDDRDMNVLREFEQASKISRP